ncbi:MAG: hypothetical protein HQK60_17510 [Deltaproteobacteria bacterium]|nr:hypothetical protein [Deltaproteobacteria bacterium]
MFQSTEKPKNDTYIFRGETPDGGAFNVVLKESKGRLHLITFYPAGK